MVIDRKRYWFPAKRYGWGWGAPSTWEGWVLMTIFIALVVGTAFVFPPDIQPGRYLGSVFLLAATFVAIAKMKGEPPRWRWGGD